MRAYLLINNASCIDYVKEDGLSINKTERRSKTVTTMDGTLIKKSIEKYEIDVNLLDMSDAQLRTNYINNFTPNPAQVSLSDFDSGQIINGTFYIEGLTYDVKKTIGTISYLTNISFKLIQKV